MDFLTYKMSIATLLVIWGILNILSGDPLNIAKGLCGVGIGLIIAFGKVNQRITQLF